MNVLITGADGFIGRRLVARLLERDQLSVTSVTLVDVAFASAATDARVRQVAGSIADAAVLEAAFACPVDCVYHLASIPGGAAERNYALGLAVNLQASLAMLEQLRMQQRGALCVFASTIAVYGPPDDADAVIDDSTALRPALSYGAHKLAVEVLVEDYSRRGWIDGRIVRLPGIVARPAEPSGLLSAFMSDVFWRLSAGQRFVCPVSPDATMWWMSVECCVDNLLHAAAIAPKRIAARRAYTLPVLRLSMHEVVAALALRFGADRAALVDYRPDEALEHGFGRQPVLDATAARAIGYRDDGTVDALITRALGMATTPAQ